MRRIWLGALFAREGGAGGGLRAGPLTLSVRRLYALQSDECVSVSVSSCLATSAHSQDDKPAFFGGQRGESCAISLRCDDMQYGQTDEQIGGKRKALL